MPAIYVTGLLPDSRGKTSLAMLLAKSLADVGVPASFSKPVAIVDTATDHELVPDWLESGALYPREWVVAREAGFKWRLEDVNPLLLLTAPFDISLFFRESVPSALLAYEEDLARRTALARAYRPAGESYSMDVVLNAWALKRRVLLVNDRLIKRASSHSGRILETESLETFRGIIVGAMRDSVELALKNLKRKSVAQVLEGVSDWLFAGLKCELVVAVYRGQAALFDGVKVARALEVVSHGAAYERFRAVLSLVSPFDVVKFTPPLPGESLESAVEKNSELEQKITDYLVEKNVKPGG
ncbi:hypothetical protein IG193_02875 [Infirmifilum lucidum]|uniref:Uncharacterized protein n=1 Tax=Infirmifilum lucidum TaxID=2776706 RepID=A0A7L9FI04_9CREN|nr:hypothetical protein [Infirmifilum lucidum]QOJ79420.1 hypothetical protein IG193_02875 [Infirmifilum lucidum]